MNVVLLSFIASPVTSVGVKVVPKESSLSGSESDTAGSDNPLLSKRDEWNVEMKESKKFFRKKASLSSCVIIMSSLLTFSSMLRTEAETKFSQTCSPKDSKKS